MVTNPLVYIILVNHNSWEDTIECIESLFNLEYDNYRIVVVDNSTTTLDINNIELWAKRKLEIKDTLFPELCRLTKDSINYIKLTEDNYTGIENFSLTLVKANNNLGFAAANNIVLKKIKQQNNYDFCWLLNNDTVVTKNTINNLIETHNKSKSQLIGSILYEYDRLNIVQSIGGWYNPSIGKIEVNKSVKNQKNIDYPIGASMFISKYFLDVVGLLEEQYFLFFEEYDWVLRARQKDLDFSIDTKSIIYHKGGSSIGNSSEFSDFFSIKSKLLFTKKFFKSKYLLFCLIFGSGYIINRILRGQFNRISILFKLLNNPKTSYFNE